ncbi:MAG: hypothetical protein OXE43_14105 [Chloroflexi bacterium]|nr:hypothetical protein [Chloroflexota bacterium]
MPPGEAEDALRFLDILTTASSVAHARGAAAVLAAHLLEAIDVLTGQAEVEEAGGPAALLGHRRTELAVDPAVRELTQRWFARLGSAPEATLGAGELQELRAEIEELVRS